MKKVLFLFAAILLGGCGPAKKNSVVVLPRFQGTDEHFETPSGVQLQVTSMEVLSSRAFYEEIKKGADLPTYETWKMRDVAPVRNTNLIEINIDESDPIKAGRQTEATINALQQIKTPSEYNGQKGTIQFTILQGGR